jgi:acetolactate synthase-1/2/3 large subunit
MAVLADRITPSAPRIGRPRSAAAPRGPESEVDWTGPISSTAAIERLAEHIEPGADVFIDAGNAGAFAVHHLPSDGTGRVSVALGMGAMGHAFGASIGAAIHTGRRTYVIAGDGAFFMHGLELHTALEHALPITYVILNNNAHAMCRLREERLLSGDTGTNVFAPAYLADGVGRMLRGVTAREVDSLADLDAALIESGAASGPCFLSINVPADEQPPFLPLTPTKQEVLT